MEFTPTTEQSEAIDLVSKWYKDYCNGTTSKQIFTLTGYAGCLNKKTCILVKDNEKKSIRYVTLADICKSIRKDLKFEGFIEYTSNRYQVIDKDSKIKDIKFIFSTPDDTEGYKVHLLDGTVLHGSYKQPVIVRDSNGCEHWKKFRELKEGDKVVLFNFKPSTAVRDSFQRNLGNSCFEKLGIYTNFLQDILKDFYKNYKISLKDPELAKEFNEKFASYEVTMTFANSKDLKKRSAEIYKRISSNSQCSKEVPTLSYDIRIDGTEDTITLIFKMETEKVLSLINIIKTLPDVLDSEKKIAMFTRGFLLAGELTTLRKNNVYINRKFYNFHYILSLIKLLNFSTIYNEATNFLYFVDDPSDFFRLTRNNNFRMKKLKFSNYSLVKKIEQVNGKFYDISVTGQNFIANGVVAHNTGKTTCVRSIVEDIGINVQSIALCCYTGKAASVLRSKGFKNARTIHSVFYGIDNEDDPQNITFKLREIGYIRYSYSLIILDEFSMIDSDMIRDLLSFGLPILALGDSFQLDSIGSSELTQELLNKPDYALTKVIRQAEESPILRLATDIRLGKETYQSIFAKTQNNSTYFDSEGRVKVISMRDIYPNQEIFEEALRRNYKNDFCNIVYTNKSRANLNLGFRKAIFNRSSETPPSIGDKLLCRKNNNGTLLDNSELRYLLSEENILEFLENKTLSKYNNIDENRTYTPEEIDELSFYRNSSIFNGTVGHILNTPTVYPEKVRVFDRTTKKSVYKNTLMMKIDFKPDFTSAAEYFEDIVMCIENLVDGDIEANKLPFFGNKSYNFFNYGYCITGHSSQGSEYDKVTIWHDIPKLSIADYALQMARWYYTVITRAKKKLIIVKDFNKC